MSAFRPLTEGFPQASEGQWRALAGRARNLDRLASTSMDGLRIGPVYAPGTGPLLATRPPALPWTVVQRVDRGDADTVRAKIAAALRGGATGIELVFASGAATHRRGIEPESVSPSILSNQQATVRLDAGELTPRLALDYAALGIPVVAAYDPVTSMAVRGGPGPAESAAGIAALIESLDRDSRPAVGFIADGRPWHDGGASEVQELGIVLASAVATIRLLAAEGVAADRGLRRLGLAFSADADQFLTIAKFRAARLLFARLVEVMGVGPIRPPVHAETAWRMLSRRDPTMNMVRSTTAAFAAAAGGADSVTVLSPLFEDEPFSDRMARNVQTILVEEAFLHRAGDPGAGAGAVEALTAELAGAAWELFRQIEGEGGLHAAVASGSAQCAVAAMSDLRVAKVARRQIPLVGVNVHVGRDAVAPAVAPVALPREDSKISPLRPVRLAEPFEELCARSIDESGRRRTVLVVESGRGEDRAESADAFAAGGFEVVSARWTQPGSSVGAMLARSGARVACIVVDGDNWDAAMATASALRSAGARVLVASAGSAPATAAAGFDAVLTPDTDVVSLLSAVLDRIAETHENGQS